MLDRFVTVSRSFTFEAAHRLPSHPGKCRFLHGHSYKVTVIVRPTCSIPTETDDNMIIDFATMKAMIGEWINTNWDHNTILSPMDPICRMNAQMVCGRNPYIMKSGEPTAEAMACELRNVVQGMFDEAHTSGYGNMKYKLEVDSVTVSETDNCSASCE